jgi:hypothetical protein
VADAKIIERIQKLLRTAAASSNAPRPERENAALLAAELMEEHGVEIGDLSQNRSRNGSGEPKKSKMTWGTWAPSLALQHSSCSWCHKKISPGDTVWLRVHRPGEVELRHNYEPCNQYLG